MTTKWDSFVKRRNIDVGQFLTVNGIKSRVELLAHLSKIGVEPPDEELITRLFPIPPPVVMSIEEPTSPLTAQATQSFAHSKPKSKNKND